MCARPMFGGISTGNRVSEQRALKIPPSPLRPHYVKATVRVHEEPDGKVAIWMGPHHLADYDAAGALIAPPKKLVEPPPNQRFGRGACPAPKTDQKRTIDERRNPDNLIS